MDILLPPPDLDPIAMNKVISPDQTPATTQKRRRQPAEVKERILVSALDTFANHGFEGASTREVAKGAGVSLSLLLYHFQSKELLWRAVVENVRQKMELSHSAGNITARMSATERLKVHIRDSVAIFTEIPALHRLMTLEAHQKTDRLLWMVEQFIRADFNTICATILAAQMEGTVRKEDPARLRFAIVAMAAVPFAVSAEYHELTGLDPFSSDEIEKSIELINHLVFLDPTKELP